jgi:hypothetical protein
MTALLKPCLECGELSPNSRCDDHKLKRAPRPTPSRKERNRPAALDQLSTRMRRLSPFCEYPGCGASEHLELDHIIPVSEAPELVLEPLNCRVYCRTHNRMRGNKCTDEERAQVCAAIKAKRERTQRHYAAQQTR